MGLLFNLETCYKEISPKVGCFAGFCHHYLMTMSVLKHVYHYPLLESGMQTGLKMITLYRKYTVPLSKQK